MTPDKKAATRPIVRRWLETLDFGGKERWVRMNPDLHGVCRGRHRGDHRGPSRRLRRAQAEPGRRRPEIVAIIERLEERHKLPWGSTRLLPIVTETPEGLLHIREIAGASPRIAAISWGIEDLSAAMGLPQTRDAEGRYLDIPRYARVMCAVAASAAGVEAIDTVYTDIPDLEGLRRECREGVAMSFAGKISIHPGQIEVINQEFTPSRAAADEALALIAAFEEHAARGAGAFAWKGQMMDMPHLTRAKKIADRARQAGII